jgi:hypothetical protein
MPLDEPPTTTTTTTTTTNPDPNDADPNDPDPILSSYDIYLTDSQIRRLLLQYPDRSSQHPYNDTSQQKPTELRLKPRTGLIEVDVPINTHLNYDVKKGLRYGNSLRKSRVVREGGSHGLAGGFNAGAGAGAGGGGGVGTGKGRKGKGKEYVDEFEDGDGEGEGEDGYGFDEYEQEEADRRAGVLLGKQTLGGRIKPAIDGDPLYMLGAFRGEEFHLAPLSSVVQLRPQLHHLDAFDDVAKGRVASSARARKDADGGGEDVGGSRVVEHEARAVDMKVKSAEGGDDTAVKGNNELLKRMQDEKWERFSWIDEKVST